VPQDRPTRAPAISIVTPTRNRRDVLLRAIESVQKQTLDDYEHIVVDDGSEDGTEGAVLGIADRRLHYHRLDRHRGANAARNLGIGLARSPLVTFLDSDDRYLPFRLERTVPIFSAETRIDVAISSYAASKGGTAVRIVNGSAHLDNTALERVVITQAVALAGSALTVRKTALEAVGGFDVDLWRFQDRDLLLRLAAAGFGAEMLADVDWEKHHSADSISRQRHGYLDACAAFLRRHPRVRERYPDATAYMVARRILSDLSQGRFGALLADVRANRRDPALNFSVVRLVSGYVRGRSQRRRFAREARNAPAVRPIGIVSVAAAAPSP
jgi:glycosyltransferase involved in cell wall biosynthesis